MLNLIAGFYNAPDARTLAGKRDELHERFATLERELEGRSGPYFDGAAFSLVDAVFGPVFRYFDRFEAIDDFGFFEGLPRVRAWRQALAARPSVQAAAHPAKVDYLYYVAQGDSGTHYFTDNYADFKAHGG